MAYVGHSPVHEFRMFGAAAPKGYGAAFVKSALIAMAAAAAILALSEFGGTAASPAAVAATKGDRIAAPHQAAAAGAGYSIDADARTTTVERGATLPLSAQSPFRDHQ